MSFPRRSTIPTQCLKYSFEASWFYVNNLPLDIVPSTSVNRFHPELFELAEVLHFQDLEVRCSAFQSIVILKTLIDFFIDENKNHRTREAPSDILSNSFPNSKCNDISFHHDSVMTIHELPPSNNEDPRLIEIFSKMRPP